MAIGRLRPALARLVRVFSPCCGTAAWAFWLTSGHRRACYGAFYWRLSSSREQHEQQQSWRAPDPYRGGPKIPGARVRLSPRANLRV